MNFICGSVEDDRRYWILYLSGQYSLSLCLSIGQSTLCREALKRETLNLVESVYEIIPNK